MNLNKIILCGLGAGLLLASSAQAEVNNLVGKKVEARPAADKRTPSAEANAESSKPEGILFRVENIQPITNKEGVIDRCSYMVTAYNRSDHPLKDAHMILTWTDQISGKYKIEKSQIKVVPSKEAKIQINSEINLGGIAPRKQKSFEQRVETDKCYLLLDNTQFNVVSCDVEGMDKLDTNRCTSMFNYIDSKNPEYYSEFKDVPASVLEKQAEDEKQQEIAKITETVEQINKTMDETTEILRKLK